MEPEIVYFVLCDDVQSDPKNALRTNILGVLTHLRSHATPPFPVLRPMFCALLFLTGYQGEGQLSLRIIQETTGRMIFLTTPRRVRFRGSPEEIVGMVFRFRNCSFPAPGLYWVECVFDATILGRQRLWLST